MIGPVDTACVGGNAGFASNTGNSNGVCFNIKFTGNVARSNDDDAAVSDHSEE